MNDEVSLLKLYCIYFFALVLILLSLLFLLFLSVSFFVAPFDVKIPLFFTLSLLVLFLVFLAVPVGMLNFLPLLL